MVQLDNDGSVIIVGDFQFTGRLQFLHIGHRIVCGNITDLALGGCSAAAGRLPLLDDQFVVFQRFPPLLFSALATLIFWKNTRQW